jgi:hypothetical protein
MQVSKVAHAPFICCPQRREPLVHNDTPDRPHALHTLVHSVVLTGSNRFSYRARHGASGKTGWAPARGRRAHGCAAWGLRIVKGSRRGSAATAFPCRAGKPARPGRARQLQPRRQAGRAYLPPAVRDDCRPLIPLAHEGHRYPIPSGVRGTFTR